MKLMGAQTTFEARSAKRDCAYAAAAFALTIVAFWFGLVRFGLV
jgi:hypothetical protein